MKRIKLTGKNSGLAKELIYQLNKLGYDVTGYGKGDIDLNDTHDVLSKIADAEIFINNANYDFTQTKILYELFKLWKDDEKKLIINISSRAAQPNISKGYLYAAQKAALEHLANNLVYNSDKKCRITTVSLGLLEADIESLTYEQTAKHIVKLIEQPESEETVHLSLQHSRCYTEVQAVKAARLSR